MTWPFENNTNGIVKNLAKRNLKSEKRRNVMVIVSVVLSAFLISLSGLTGVSLMQTEKKKVIDTSILFGTVIGYLLCTVFSSMSIFGRVIYHFPIVEMFIYFILMFVVQTLFSRLTIKQIKKQSLVEQVKEL